MLGLIFILACWDLGSCNKQVVEDLPTEISSTTTPCDATLVRTLPVNGATDFDYRGVIEFELSYPDPDAVITSAVSGVTTHSPDQRTLYFTPDSPLSPEASYVVSLHFCGGDADLGFTTSSTGYWVDPEILVGRTYNVDLAHARFTAPHGLGPVVLGDLPSPLLLGVTSADTSTIGLRGAVGTETATDQDQCQPTAEYPLTDFSTSPYFQMGPVTSFVPFNGILPLSNLTLAGSFTSDGTQILGGTLRAMVDMRDLSELSPYDAYMGEDLCNVAAGFGASCVACDDGELLCLWFMADGVTATMVDGELTEVTDAYCPGCEDGEPVCDAQEP